MIYITLLRGINVSGKNRILMKDFVSILLDSDTFMNVKSYIQSGNFVLESHLKNTAEISLKIQDLLLRNYQYNIEAFTYTVPEFKVLIESHPYEIFEKRNYFVFTKGNYKSIDVFLQKDFSNDQYKIQDDIIHILYDTKYSNSKLNNNYIEKQLKTTATTRNWNTVKKLIELATK